MDWITAHSDAISALASAGMLVVWLVYLQVFISSYRRGLRATLLIARGAGEGLSARCLIGNMSSGAIYISSVQVRLETAARDVSSAVTNVDPEGPGSTRQGPLKEGCCQDIGSFGELIREGLAAAARGHDEVSRITVEVVAVYGSEDLPVGARRTFLIRHDADGPTVHGCNTWTDQIRRRRERRALRDVLARDL